MTFIESKKKFDDTYKNTLLLKKSLVPINGKYIENISLKNKQGKPSEEFYKWQFVYSIIDSNLYSKDFIGTEIHFPKGNKNSSPIKIDACIFDNKDWIDHYEKWIKEKNDDSIEWLRNHLIAIIEFKKSDGKDVKKVFVSQIKAELKESELPYCLGFYYDTERLYVFQKENGKILRYDESKNEKGEESSVNQLSLELTDAYNYIPSFTELLNRINKPFDIDRSKRTVDDLDLITDVHSSQINTAISNILKKMDKVGLVDQRGYEILIQMLALKIFDEKRSDKYKKYLEFYETQKEQKNLNLLFFITQEEKEYLTLNDESIQNFIKRIRKLYNDASIEYKIILSSIDTETINWKNENHIKAISSIVENLQDYSFIKSSETDLYQLVFHRFANTFTKIEKGQFVTPLKLIDFLVKIVKPKSEETIIDPAVGIADFLSLSYVNSKGTIDDKNIYGVDIDKQMIMLAKLNMLLNGDGNAVLKCCPDYGSLVYKFNTDKELVCLDTKQHKNGKWDEWLNQTKLIKFNVVLTNPPFGDNRKFEPKTNREKEVAELYELWNIARYANSIDLGLLFLENAYRILEENGRLGIVLSNSIASIDRWEDARKWLMSNMRIVALFDLPANTFADTGVNTTLIVAYKPSKKELERLKKDNYEIFTRDIKNIGYEIRTIKRVKNYFPVYKIDEEKLEIMMDENGKPVLNEDFTTIIKEFREWAKNQEKTLKELFL
jgi:type I restriction enzyme M protein